MRSFSNSVVDRKVGYLRRDCSGLQLADVQERIEQVHHRIDGFALLSATPCVHWRPVCCCARSR